MILPTAADLLTRPDLVPMIDLADRLEEAIAAVEKHQRNASVSVTFKVSYDAEVDIIDVVSAVKSKRPVQANRNEEVLGEEHTILRLRREIPGQQRLPASNEELVQTIRETDQKLEAAGASMTVETKDGTKVTLGKGRKVEKPRPFVVGDRVRHTIFGLGRITRFTGTAAAVIAFDDHGEKELEAAFVVGKLFHATDVLPKAKKPAAKNKAGAKKA